MGGGSKWWRLWCKLAQDYHSSGEAGRPQTLGPLKSSCRASSATWLRHLPTECPWVRVLPKTPRGVGGG
eukprot:5442854-Prorocentrum_lima.AAC.1